jgi:integrase
MAKTTQKKGGKKFTALGDGLYRKERRIYFRTKVRGNWSWLSTGTGNLPLARKWRENRQRELWLRQEGLLPDEVHKHRGAAITIDQLLEEYVDAGHPIVKGRVLKTKSPCSIRNEQYSLKPLRKYFGKMHAADLTLADCDRYLKWRTAGGYVAEFTCRGRKITKRTLGGCRIVDLQLTFLSNACELAVRRGHLKTNPLRDRGRYTDKDQIRHCRDVSPTPAELQQIVEWLSANDQQQYADFTQFLAYSGLRVGEGQKVEWGQVNWSESLIHVKRSKKGLVPFVPLLPEMHDLLERMKKDMTDARLIFPAPFLTDQPLNYSAYRRYLAKACVKLGIRHVTPHGLRSYFVTQARQSGLTDAEIAQLIGDKTGPSIIEQVYGDVRPDHLLAIARKIQLTASTRDVQATPSSEP